MDLSLTIEHLPPNAKKCSVKIGSQRTKLAHVATLEPLPTEEEILDCLNHYGFGIEYQYARLMWYDEGRTCVKSLALTEKIQEEEEKTTIGILVDGILDMAAEQRRFLSTLNQTLNKREETLSIVLDKFMLAQEETLTERSTALALDIALQEAEQSQNSSYKEMAVQHLGNVAQTYIESKKASPETLKKLILENEHLVDELLNDQEIVSVIGSKFLAKKTE